MPSNLDKYRSDLDALIKRGESLQNAMSYEARPEEFKAAVKRVGVKDVEALLKKLPSFSMEYQAWYSEAVALVRQLLPDRLADFVRQYEKPKSRKEITSENYSIEDFLHGLNVTRGYEKTLVVGPSAAIPRYEHQLNIVRAVSRRFESTLFDVKQLVQADIFDSEIEAARELLKHKFTRAAGAVAGVVLEKHLGQVCENHKIKVGKRDPNIGDLNDALKAAAVLDTPTWRSIQHLGDLRNLCDHDKKKEPTTEQAQDLVDGVEKTTKTLF